MNGNIDHAATAQQILDGVHTLDSLGQADLAALIAQVHATLALVEQQRIANLIALAQVKVHATDQYSRYAGVIYEASKGVTGLEPALRADIRQGLGLS